MAVNSNSLSGMPTTNREVIALLTNYSALVNTSWLSTTSTPVPYIHLDVSVIPPLFAPGNYITWILVTISVTVDAVRKYLNSETARIRGRTAEDVEPRDQFSILLRKAHYYFRKICPLDANALYAVTYPTIAAFCLLRRRAGYRIADGNLLSDTGGVPLTLEDLVYISEVCRVCIVAKILLRWCCFLMLFPVAERVYRCEVRRVQVDAITGTRLRSEFRYHIRGFWRRFDLRLYVFLCIYAFVDVTCRFELQRTRSYDLFRKLSGLPPFEWQIDNSGRTDSALVYGVIIYRRTQVETNFTPCLQPPAYSDALEIPHQEWLIILSIIPLLPVWRTRIMVLRSDLSRISNCWIGIQWGSLIYVFCRVVMVEVFIKNMGFLLLHISHPPGLPKSSSKLGDVDQLVPLIIGIIALGGSFYRCLLAYAGLRSSQKRDL